MNCSKAKKKLKWKENIKFNKGLGEMVRWLKNRI